MHIAGVASVMAAGITITLLPTSRVFAVGHIAFVYGRVFDEPVNIYHQLGVVAFFLTPAILCQPAAAVLPFKISVRQAYGTILSHLTFTALK